MRKLEKIPGVNTDITNYEDLYKWYKKLTKDKDTEPAKGEGTWIFRGLSDSIHDLKTTLERAINDTDGLDLNNAIDIESGLLRRFKRGAKSYLSHIPKDNDYMQWFALMQHYGAPTRLLDWSYSFWVAVFIAVEKAKHNGKCRVWAYNTKANKKLDSFFSNSEEIKCAQRIKTDDPNGLKAKNFETVFLRQLPISFVCSVNPHDFNERLAIQQGVFLCPGNIKKSFEENLRSTFDNDDKKIKNHLKCISIDLNGGFKNKILKMLHRMNMNYATLFPGLEGYARSMKSLLAFGGEMIPPYKDKNKKPVYTPQFEE